MSDPTTPPVERVPLDSLVEDPRNARLHPARNLAAIRASLERFGQQKPIVVRRSDRTVIAGNGTLAAARSLGWADILVIWTDLEGDAAAAFGIADNKTSDLAEWDFQELSIVLRELDRDFLSATGFADFEIGPLLAADWTPPPVAVDHGRAQHETFTATPEQSVSIRAAIEAASALLGEGATEGAALEMIALRFLETA